MSTYREVLDREKIRIAFMFQIASFWPSWESLYNFLSKAAEFDVKLILVNDRIDNAKQLESAETFLKSNSILYTPFTEDLLDSFLPHIAVVQTPYDTLQRPISLYSRRLKIDGIRVMYIPYGIELADTKAARHDHFREPVIINAWRIYTLSNEFRREYDKYCPNSDSVRGLGLPRFDMLRQKELFKLSDDLNNKIKSRKVVIWHTHFTKRIDIDGEKRQVTPYLDEYVKFAQQLDLYKEKCFFIFMPHPRFGDDAIDFESNEKSGFILKLLKTHENVYIDCADDYRHSLLNADVIITDRSAIMVESSVVGVPVLYLKNPDYAEPLFPPIAPIVEQYDIGYTCQDIQLFLNNFLIGELKQAVSATIPNFDGGCAKRIANDILVSLSTKECTKKSLNRIILFGTGFLYNKMRETFNFDKYCQVIALSDNNPDKWNMWIDNKEVIPPNKINELAFDKIVIMAGNVFEEEIKQQLMFDLEIPENKIELCDYLAMLGCV